MNIGQVFGSFATASSSLAGSDLSFLELLGDNSVTQASPEQAVGSLVAQGGQAGSARRSDPPSNVVGDIQRTLGVAGADLSGVHFYEVDQWNRSSLSQIDPPLSERTLNDISNDPYVGMAFREGGQVYAISNRSEYATMGQSFGLTRSDAENYIRTQEAVHAWTYKTDPSMPISSLEAIGEAVTAQRYPEPALSFGVFHAMNRTGEQNYSIIRAHARNSVGEVLMSLPGSHKKDQYALSDDFMKGFKDWTLAKGITPENTPDKPYPDLIKEYLGIFFEEKGIKADPGAVYAQIAETYVGMLTKSARQALE